MAFKKRKDPNGGQQVNITLKKDMNGKFTLEENRLLASLIIPNSSEKWRGITIKNEEIALLDYFYGATLLGFGNANLAMNMLRKCNPKIVDLALEN